MALGFMRRHRGWLKYMLLLVVVAFIILYIPAFQEADTGAPGEVVATVGGDAVTRGEFQRVYQSERQRMSANGLDPAMIEQLGLEEQVLQALIDRKLVIQEARRLGLTVDDDAVAREIATLPSFQSRGRFVGADEVRRVLALQGRSEEEFTESVREQLMVERLQALVTDGVQVSDQEAEREFRRRNEKVKIEYVAVDAAPFRAQVAADDAEIAARFQSQRESYRIPERRVVGYLLLDPAALQKEAQVTDGEIQAYYRDNEQQFSQPEEMCARHILIKVKATPEGPGHTEDEARTQAQALLDQVKKGSDLGELARTSSEDVGSATQGGDLGCFPPGVQVSEFDQALSALSPGQVSDLVRTKYGFHVIQLISRQGGDTRPLAAVKDGIRQTLLGRKMRELAQQKAAQISEALRKGDGLEAAGKSQGLAVQKSGPLGRADRVPPLDSPELLARAFTLAPGATHPEPFGTSAGWAFISVLEVQPTRVPELAEAKERVRADVVEQKARALARARAEELRARAQAEGLEKAAGALGLTRAETPEPVGRGEALGALGAGPGLEEAAYTTDVQGVAGPVATANGYAVLRVLEKTPFDAAAFAQEKPTLVASLEQQHRQRLFQAYLERVRERFPVERRSAALQRTNG
jgi:peptidyl-prolyl cis-trans isomerase D